MWSFSRFSYKPPIYNWTNFGETSSPHDYNPNQTYDFKLNCKRRKEFQEYMKRRDISRIRMILDGVFDSLIYTCDRKYLYKDIIIFEELPKEIEKRKKLQRYEVSRVAMRKGIPSDLVPWICAFTVPGSKIYPYMK